MEQKRLKRVLELQFLLERLGDESVRQELLQGAGGPSLLTESDLTSLDEFYKLVGPERDQNIRWSWLSSQSTLLFSISKWLVNENYAVNKRKNWCSFNCNMNCHWIESFRYIWISLRINFRQLEVSALAEHVKFDSVFLTVTVLLIIVDLPVCIQKLKGLLHSKKSKLLTLTLLNTEDFSLY